MGRQTSQPKRKRRRRRDESKYYENKKYYTKREFYLTSDSSTELSDDDDNHPQNLQPKQKVRTSANKRNLRKSLEVVISSSSESESVSSSSSESDESSSDEEEQPATLPRRTPRKITPKNPVEIEPATRNSPKKRECLRRKTKQVTFAESDRLAGPSTISQISSDEVEQQPTRPERTPKKPVPIPTESTKPPNRKQPKRCSKQKTKRVTIAETDPLVDPSTISLHDLNALPSKPPNDKTKQKKSQTETAQITEPIMDYNISQEDEFMSVDFPLFEQQLDDDLFETINEDDLIAHNWESIHGEENPGPLYDSTVLETTFMDSIINDNNPMVLTCFNENGEIYQDKSFEMFSHLGV